MIFRTTAACALSIWALSAVAHEAFALVPTATIAEARSSTRSASFIPNGITTRTPTIAESVTETPKKLSIEAELHGYYRVRGYKIHNLFPIAPAAFGGEPAATETRFILHRLRLEPVIHITDVLKLKLQVDALDDIVWGDNAGLSSIPLFSTDLSTTPRSGGSFSNGEAFIPSVDLKRVWLEIRLPIGQLRIGRMPSQWGLGLLANAADGFDDDFGDNHFGSTNDRVLFATRPVSIVRGIQGEPKVEHPLIVAYAFDKIVTTALDVTHGEDPARRLRSSAWLGRRFDQDGDGVIGEDPIDGIDNDGDGRTDEDPPGNNDVNEHVLVVLWNEPNAWGLSPDDDLKLGTYIVYRQQGSTDSNAWIVDLYGMTRAGPWYGEAEALGIFGRSKAIPLGDRDKKADIFGGVLRLGHLGPRLHLIFEIGYASGDSNVLDETFSRRPLHPDYNVGLLLYEEVLAEATARHWGADARGLWSDGGVYSSFYFFPRIRYFPMEGYNLRVIAGVLTAFGVDPECATIYDSDDVCRVPPNTEDIDSPFPYLGTELDLAVKYSWWEEHMEAALELGYLFIGSGLLNEQNTPNPRSAAWTLQSRIAFVF